MGQILVASIFTVFFSSICLAQTILSPIDVYDDLGSLTESKVTDERSAQSLSVPDTLSTAPSLTVESLGSNRGQSGFFLRGFSSSRVLVLKDGLPVADSSDPTRSVDLSLLSNATISQWRVVRGAQSLIYGSEAIGGVILLDGPSFGANQLGLGAQVFSLGGEAQSVSWSSSSVVANLNRVSEVGISSSGSQLDEEDGYHQESARVAARVGGFVFRAEVNQIAKELDRSNNYLLDDDSNYETDSRQQIFSVEAKAYGRIQSQWVAGVTFTDRETVNRPDDGSSQNLESDYRSTNYTVRSSHRTQFGPHLFDFGLDYRREEARSNYDDGGFVSRFSNKSLDQLGLYQVFRNPWHRWQFDVGFREQFLSNDEQVIIYQTGLAYQLSDFWKLHYQQGSGYRSPSLFQLYDGSSGNEDLEAEVSEHWELGLLFDSKSTWKSELRVFQTRIENAIDWDVDRYYNRDSEYYQGVEFVVGRPTSWGEAQASYTYIDALSEDKALARRARHQAKASATYIIDSAWSSEGRLIYLGPRPDINGGRLSSFTDLGASLVYRWQDYRFSLGGKNLLNQTPAPALGFGRPGRQWLFSVLKTVSL